MALLPPSPCPPFEYTRTRCPSRSGLFPAAVPHRRTPSPFPCLHAFVAQQCLPSLTRPAQLTVQLAQPPCDSAVIFTPDPGGNRSPPLPCPPVPVATPASLFVGSGGNSTTLKMRPPSLKSIAKVLGVVAVVAIIRYFPPLQPSAPGDDLEPLGKHHPRRHHKKDKG